MPIIPQSYTCTPSSLLASTPCLACLSEKQMLAVLLGIMAVKADKEVSTMLEDSSCFMCTSRKQMLQSLVTVMGNALLGEGTTVSDVLERVKCLECASETQLLAAIMLELCQARWLGLEMDVQT